MDFDRCLFLLSLLSLCFYFILFWFIFVWLCILSLDKWIRSTTKKMERTTPFSSCCLLYASSLSLSLSLLSLLLLFSIFYRELCTISSSNKRRKRRRRKRRRSSTAKRTSIERKKTESRKKLSFFSCLVAKRVSVCVHCLSFLSLSLLVFPVSSFSSSLLSSLQGLTRARENSKGFFFFFSTIFSQLTIFKKKSSHFFFSLFLSLFSLAVCVRYIDLLRRYVFSLFLSF